MAFRDDSQGLWKKIIKAISVMIKVDLTQPKFGGRMTILYEKRLAVSRIVVRKC